MKNWVPSLEILSTVLFKTSRTFFFDNFLGCQERRWSFQALNPPPVETVCVNGKQSGHNNIPIRPLPTEQPYPLKRIMRARKARF